MRRRTPGSLNADQLVSDRIARIERIDPHAVVRALEPAVTEQRRARLKAVLAQRISSLTVLFDSPHDPHNGAAVVRSCEAFGIQTLHVIEAYETFLAAASVARGAQKWVDVVCHKQGTTAIDAMIEGGYELIAAHPDGELVPADLARIERFSIVLGNERNGIRPELLGACRRFVKVPMRGFVESLNVSVTAAILLSAATHGREGDLDEAARLRLYARGLYYSIPHADDYLAAAGLEQTPAPPPA
jgi:tRNA (guanosine-2'-O-)-methyltransferase